MPKTGLINGVYDISDLIERKAFDTFIEPTLNRTKCTKAKEIVVDNFTFDVHIVLCTSLQTTSKEQSQLQCYQSTKPFKKCPIVAP